MLHDAAVLGQVGGLAAIADRDVGDLEAALDRLEAREFLQRAPAGVRLLHYLRCQHLDQPWAEKERAEQPSKSPGRNSIASPAPVSFSTTLER